MGHTEIDKSGYVHVVVEILPPERHRPPAADARDERLKVRIIFKLARLFLRAGRCGAFERVIHFVERAVFIQPAAVEVFLIAVFDHVVDRVKGHGRRAAGGLTNVEHI